MIFLDNHDIPRFFSVIDENVTRYRSALTWLLTCRGIPQLYYGDELALTGTTTPSDGYVRQDFPGGWPGDAVNKFSKSGRTPLEENVWSFLATLANFRKGSPALTTGKMMQYVPVEGVYTYFRFDTKQTIMIVLNTANEKKNIVLSAFPERTNGYSKMRNIISGTITAAQNFTLDAKESAVFELLK